MKRITLAAIALLAFAGVALAQVAGTNTVVPLGFCQFSPSTATSFSSSCASGGKYVWMCATTATVYWRDDGVAPAGTVGSPIAAGSCVWYAGTLSNLSFISATGAISINVYK